MKRTKSAGFLIELAVQQLTKQGYKFNTRNETIKNTLVLLDMMIVIREGVLSYTRGRVNEAGRLYANHFGYDSMKKLQKATPQELKKRRRAIYDQQRKQKKKGDLCHKRIEKEISFLRAWLGQLS